MQEEEGIRDVVVTGVQTCALPSWRNAPVFRGANAISLDAKGRLAMPSRYRDELISRSSGQLIITIDAVDPCLCVYPLDEWELIETKLRALPSLREENRRLQRLLIGNAVDLELDGSGRFLVPPRLRDRKSVVQGRSGDLGGSRSLDRAV